MAGPVATALVLPIRVQSAMGVDVVLIEADPPKIYNLDIRVARSRKRMSDCLRARSMRNGSRHRTFNRSMHNGFPDLLRNLNVGVLVVPTAEVCVLPSAEPASVPELSEPPLDYCLRLLPQNTTHYETFIKPLYC